MRLHDTLTREQQAIAASDGHTYRFYCCGPTVYGAAHIGNFRTFLLQDVFRRALEAGGMKTFHVRNITDVDDKTIRQSRAEGKTLKAFTDYWRDRFHKDCEAFNILPPHKETGAVDHIPHQIELIKKLVDTGHAYEKNGSVYYRVNSFRHYGRLSHLQEREITTGQPATEGVQDADEYERDSPADFALWKAYKPDDGDNAWQSPWGKGRPGWHIECSAMAMAYLGETMDLHSGGIDLVFPHHENEIAQSEAVTNKPFARHWFHITHLLVNNQKMSKSLGNLYTLDDIQKAGFTAMEARYVLTSGHYRQPLNYTQDSLHAARSALEKLARFDGLLREKSGNAKPDFSKNEWGAFEKAWNALSDDLNTPQALGEIFTAIKEIESSLKQNKLDSKSISANWQGWSKLIYAFGFKFEKTAEQKIEIPVEIRQLAEARWAARQSKDWAKSDVLRKELADKGWNVKDGKDAYELTTLPKS